MQGITDLITIPGLINLDFADVKSIMQGAGSALMGIGSATGDQRAVDAAQQAISSPLLEASIEGAHGVLLSISGGSDLGLFEINEAARVVTETVHAEANVIFGAVIDDALGDEVRVTVIAAGFDRTQPHQKRLPVEAMFDGSAPTPVPKAEPVARANTTAPNGLPNIPPPAKQPAAARRDNPAPRKPIVFDDAAGDDLDVPDFLK